MIKSFKHKGLELFYNRGNTKGIQANHAKKLRLQLAVLDTALNVQDCDVPGYRLHQLKGNKKNLWSISVSGNWKLTFEFIDGHIHILNYEDYH